MNRFEKHIVKNGIHLSSGSTRVAYLYKDKVYKIPFDRSDQTHKEKKFFELVPEQYKKFFPNPEFIGRMIKMDLVETIAFDYGNYEDAHFYNNSKIKSLESLPKNVELTDLLLRQESPLYFFLEDINQPKEEIASLLKTIRNLGGYILDILDNSSNFGVNKKGEFKIVDWGL